MRKLLMAIAVAGVAGLFTLPAPAAAKDRADGVRGKIEHTDISAHRRRWHHRHWHRHRHWGHRHWRHRHWGYRPYYWRPRAYYWGPRYRYRPAYWGYYRPYRYYRPYYAPRPFISVGFGIGPRWWW